VDNYLRIKSVNNINVNMIINMIMTQFLKLSKLR